MRAVTLCENLLNYVSRPPIRSRRPVIDQRDRRKAKSVRYKR